MTEVELRALEAVTEYAADCAAERDERPACIKAARTIIEEEKRMQHLMEAPPCYGAGCPACK